MLERGLRVDMFPQRAALSTVTAALIYGTGLIYLYREDNHFSADSHKPEIPHRWRVRYDMDEICSCDTIRTGQLGYKYSGALRRHYVCPCSL